jgi:hypothetical protein
MSSYTRCSDVGMASEDSEGIAATIAEQVPTAENAVELAHQWLIAEPPQVYESRAGRRIGVATVEEVERRRRHRGRREQSVVAGVPDLERG